MTSEALRDFGQAIRKARTARGWTLELLAHNALGNQERKSYVSAVERGKVPLTPLTAQKFARALGLPDAVVDPVLMGAPDAEPDTARTEAGAATLLAEVEGLRRRLQMSEALAVALAYDFADGNPTDLESALRELRRAFEVWAQQRDRLPGNIDAAVTAIIAEVRRLNDAGDTEAAMRLIRNELAASRDRIAEQQAAHLRLIDTGLAQAVLDRSVEDATTLELEKWRLDGGGFDALWTVRGVWYERGRDKGLAFDLEVSIALARASHDLAQTADQRGAALNDLGIALGTLGARESGTARLEEAVAAYRAALEEFTSDGEPLDWATTQNNLGTALGTLGARESGTTRLEEAVAAYRAALEERTRDHVPLDWAMTQANLGTALLTLGERESGTARLEEAVAAYRAALQERTCDRVPLDWAGTSYILGYTEALLGGRMAERDRVQTGIARIESAIPLLEEGGHEVWAEGARTCLAKARVILDGLPGA